MYIWLKEVKLVLDGVVHFEDGSEGMYTPTQLEYIVTETPFDPSTYRELVIANALPDIQKTIEGDDVHAITGKILDVMEKHDLSNAEVNTVLARLTGGLVAAHNAFLKETVWKEIEEFQANKEKYQTITGMVADSYMQGLFDATRKAFGTYKEDEPAETGVENIRISDIKRFIRN